MALPVLPVLLRENPTNKRSRNHGESYLMLSFRRPNSDLPPVGISTTPATTLHSDGGSLAGVYSPSGHLEFPKGFSTPLKRSQEIDEQSGAVLCEVIEAPYGLAYCCVASLKYRSKDRRGRCLSANMKQGRIGEPCLQLFATKGAWRKHYRHSRSHNPPELQCMTCARMIRQGDEDRHIVDCPPLLERAITALKIAYPRQDWIRHRTREQWLRRLRDERKNSYPIELPTFIHR